MRRNHLHNYVEQQPVPTVGGYGNRTSILIVVVVAKRCPVVLEHAGQVFEIIYLLALYGATDELITHLQ